MKMWTDGLPSIDSFDEVDPIFKSRKEILDYDLMVALSINKDRLVEGWATVQGKDDGAREWEDPNDDGCAFDLFDDDEWWWMKHMFIIYFFPSFLLSFAKFSTTK